MHGSASPAPIQKTFKRRRRNGTPGESFANSATAWRKSPQRPRGCMPARELGRAGGSSIGRLIIPSIRHAPPRPTLVAATSWDLRASIRPCSQFPHRRRFLPLQRAISKWDRRRPTLLGPRRYFSNFAPCNKTAPWFRVSEFRSVQQTGAVVPGVLVAAFVGPAQQTIGAGNRNAISSGVWGSALDPVMAIGWAPFRNVDGQRLRMTLGAYTTANDLQVFGCLWGDAQLAYK